MKSLQRSGGLLPLSATAVQAMSPLAQTASQVAPRSGSTERHSSPPCSTLSFFVGELSVAKAGAVTSASMSNDVIIAERDIHNVLRVICRWQQELYSASYDKAEYCAQNSSLGSSQVSGHLSD